jgi:Glutathione synthase/Ribosomal protein S6 modification enzyme (glutaminyl transferase)
MIPLFFVTSAEHAQLSPDDLVTVPTLADYGFEVRPLVWSAIDPDDLPAGAILVVRSAWDYHLSAAEFEKWLRGLAKRGARIFNPVHLMRWNLDKAYLMDLIGRGVDVIPTELVRRSSTETLSEIMRSNAWTSVVVKPSISASAYRTIRVMGSFDLAKGEQHFDELRQTRDVIVQPYLSEVITHGEWSLMFFCGEFSHAVVKKPATGDFRVQAEHGGVAKAAKPRPGILKSALQVVAALPEVPLYARIDGVEVSGRFLLMEAECIDPYLYFGLNPAAPSKFASCLSKMLAEMSASFPSKQFQET